MSTAYEKVTSPACGADPAMLLTADEQARLRRKINWRILPIVFVVYLVSFLDRSAAGNGRLYSLEADLAMSQSQFSWALSAFFILYILAELPSNMGLKRTSPSRWLAFLVCGWGATVVVSAWATNFAFFLAMRVLLGGFEGGVLPALLYYMTLWYDKKDQAKSIARFWVSIAIAGAIGGLLAYLIGLMNGHGGWSAWRYLFLLEGIPAIVMALVVLCFLPDYPDTTKWLSANERAFLVARLKHGGQFKTGAAAPAGDSESKVDRESNIDDEPLHKMHKMHEMHKTDTNDTNDNGAINNTDERDDASASSVSLAPRNRHSHAEFKAALLDSDVWVLMFLCLASALPLYAMALLMPTIIASMGFTALQTQLLTIPPYVLAAIAVLSLAHLCDRTQQRALAIAPAMAVSGACFMVLLGLGDGGNHWVKYGVLCVALPFVYGPIPVIFSWNSVNSNRSDTVRLPAPGDSSDEAQRVRADYEAAATTRMSTTAACLVMAANVSGVIAGQMYRKNDSGSFSASHAANGAVMLVAAAAAVVLRLVLVRRNKRNAGSPSAWHFST